MNRPLVLIIIICVCMLGGTIGLVVGLILDLQWPDLEMLIMTLAASLFLFLVGIGLWKRSNSARLLLVVVSAVSLLTGIVWDVSRYVYMPFTYPFSWRGLLLGIPQRVFSVWTIIYLMLPRVRRYFVSPPRNEDAV